MLVDSYKMKHTHIFRICQFIGLFPLNIASYKSWKNKLITCINLFFLMVVFLYKISSFGIENLFSDVDKGIHVSELVVQYCSILCIYKRVFFGDRLLVIIKAVKEIDRKLLKEFLVIRDGSQSYYQWVFGPIIIFILIVIDYLLVPSPITSKVFLFLPYIYITLAESMFHEIGRQLTEIFELLTVSLLEVKLRTICFDRPRGYSLLVEIHQICLKLCMELNDSFSFQLLSVVMTAFYISLIQSYMCGSLLTMSFHVTSGLCLWLSMRSMKHIFWASEVHSLIKVCNRMSNKAKEFSTLAYNIAIEDNTKELIGNEMLLLHLMLNREVKFTACGFFPLDNSLVHSMIAAATTYLIILIQFGPYTDKKGQWFQESNDEDILL